MHHVASIEGYALITGALSPNYRCCSFLGQEVVVSFLTEDAFRRSMLHASEANRDSLHNRDGLVSPFSRGRLYE